MLLEPYVNGIEKSASRPTLAWGAPQGLRVDPVRGSASTVRPSFAKP